MRRTFLAVVASLALLAGCADAGEPADPETPLPTATTETTEEGVQPTTQPTEDADVEVPGQEPSPDPEVTASEPAENIDVHDGFRTADFLKMPQQFGDLNKTAHQSSVPEHRAVVEYEASDNMSKSQFTAFYPEAAGEMGPIDDVDDERYQEELAKAERDFGEDYGDNPVALSVQAGGMDWDCFGLSRDHDYSLCMTVMYGRVLEVQYIAVHAPDVTARQQAAEENLIAMAEAIADLG